jgi:methylmalonyl-CoA/ethylmalonyl-CoA epimerase
MLKGVHHIAYLVEDLDAATKQFVDVFGGKFLSRRFFEPSGVEVVMVDLGNVVFELVLPVQEGTDSWKHMQVHGPGFYHIAFLVDDINAALPVLEKGGVGLIDRAAVPGVDWDVAWLTTESMLNVPSQLAKPKAVAR